MKLGIANVDALGRSLTAKQLRGWEHYAELEPFSELREDYRVASILQMIANVNRSAKQKPYNIQDFLLKFGESQEEKEQPRNTRDMQISVIKAIAMAYSAPAKEM